MAVKFIVDSGCDLSQTQAEALGVILVPMSIHFGCEEYRSGVNLTNEEFYKKLAASRELPTTSQPTPYDFETVYRQVKSNGDEAVVLCISSALSGTYQSAAIAAADFQDRIYVVDTYTVTIAQRILLEYAFQLREKGCTAAQIAAQLEEKKSSVRVYGAVDTLEYLIKGGRLSKAAGAVGTVLGIRPVLTVRDGVLVVAGKARGPKASITMLKNFAEEDGIDLSMPFLAGYTGTDPQIIDGLSDAFSDTLHNIPVSEIGSTIGTHAGPGLVGFAFFHKT